MSGISDPIGDMFTRIRNASLVKKEKVDVPSSKLKLAIAKVLMEEGFIANYKFIEDRKQGIIRIYLKYTSDNQSVIKGIKRVSRPGLRIYRKREDIPLVYRGLGRAIISTTEGILTDQQCRERGLGGEVLGYVW